MASVLEILIRARDEASAAVGRVSGAVSDLGSKSQSISQRLSDVGGSLTRTLTPAAAGAALALGRIAETWNEARRTLTLGNTPREFEALMQSARAVAGQVPQSFAAVAEALDEVSDRTQLTGKPLERLTTRFLQLEHVSGQAASTTIPAVTKAFADWGVKVHEQETTLDAFMRASEASGLGVADLAAKVQQFGAPLRQLGFSLTDATAMFAAFERSGVNTAAVMPGLRMALKSLTAPSDELARTLRRLGIDAKEPKTALSQLFQAIKDAPSQTKATELALQVFGARAGPALASAVREGKLDFAAFVREIEGGKATIADAAERSMSLADRMQTLRNRIVGAIGPFAELGAAVASGLAAVGPALLGLAQIGPALGALVSPVGLVVAALAALGAGLVLAYQRSEAFRSFVQGLVAWFQDRFVPALQEVGEWLVSTFGPLLGQVAEIVRSVLDGISALWRRWGDEIMGILETIATFIGRTVQHAMEFIANVVRAVLAIIRGDWGAAWDAIKDAAGAAWNLIRNVIGTAVRGIKELVLTVLGALRDAVGGIWDKITDAASRAWEGLKAIASRVWGAIVGAIRSAVNLAIDAINWLIRGMNKVAGALDFVAGPWVNWGDIPQIPHLARGGIVIRPMVAMVGESGPEAVIPLRSRALGGITVIVQGDVLTEQQLIDKIHEGLLRKQRRNVGLGLI